LKLKKKKQWLLGEDGEQMSGMVPGLGSVIPNNVHSSSSTQTVVITVVDDEAR
jgi:hypothetical protein